MTRRVPWAVGLLMVAVLAAALWSRQRAARMDAWFSIAERGNLVIAMDAAFPPYERIDGDGAAQGLDVELANLLADRWGVSVQFVNISFDGLYDALALKRADMILSALPYDTLLTSDVIYSKPYSAGGQVLVARRDTEAVRGIADLQGATVAVELGTEGHALLSRLNRDTGTDVTIDPVNDIALAAEAVRERRAEALICDRVAAANLVEDGTLRVVGEPLTSEPYVIAVRPDSPLLAREIDAALADLSRDGTLSRLEQRWLRSSGY
jgi:ABC-type amino acid transport substrate-binding protein